jgi:hypothetical protein
MSEFPAAARSGLPPRRSKSVLTEARGHVEIVMPP